MSNQNHILMYILNVQSSCEGPLTSPLQAAAHSNHNNNNQENNTKKWKHNCQYNNPRVPVVLTEIIFC